MFGNFKFLHGIDTGLGPSTESKALKMRFSRAPNDTYVKYSSKADRIGYYIPSGVVI